MKLTPVITSLRGGIAFRLRSRRRCDALRLSRLRVESHVKVSRSAGRAVLAAAQENQADLIVLGAIPRLLGRRMFLGNTVEFVLHHAACAVALFIPAARRAGTA